jgi:hypothetical protein
MATVVALVPDLLFGSKVQGMLAAAGHDVALGGDPAGADVLVVDLMVDGIDVEALATSGPATLGVFAHTQPDVRDRALAAGFDLVVPRSRMVREGAELVARLASQT